MLPLGAQALTLSFDELPAQSANGVTVSGVTFGFGGGGADPNDATYGYDFGASLMFVGGDVLEGDVAGTLTIDLSTPSSIVEFGVALNGIGNIAPGFSVELLRLDGEDLLSIGSFDVDTSSLVTFSEGHFSYDGELVSQILVDFDDTFPQIERRFLFDNLTIQPVPEPRTALLLASGLAGLAATARRARR